MRLWEACQLPDFQKTTIEEHIRLSRDVFHALTGKRGRLTEDWFAPRFNDLDRDDGQIDQLSARLSGVRTLSYIANRPDWLEGAKGWRDRTRALEDRLSDVLHERLTARFVDRKTTALLRSLHDREATMAEVAPDGIVTVDGETVGHMEGVRFAPDAGGSALADRTLKAAALRAVTPEIMRRLGKLAGDADDAFAVTPEGDVLWSGALAARIVNTDPFSPRVRLIGDLGPQAARDRAQRRIEAWLASEAGRALRDLRRLKQAVESGAIKGLPRGIAFRLLEAGGVIDRRDVERDLAALSQAERRTIKAFAIRVGTHSVWLPGALKPRGRVLSQAFTAAEPFRAKPQGLSLLPIPAPSPRALSAYGVRAAGRWAVPVEDLERASDLRRENQGNLSDEALASLGWTTGDARAIWAALKTVRAQMPDREGRPVVVRPDSPFAKLAELTAQPEPARRKRRRGAHSTAAAS